MVGKRPAAMKTNPVYSLLRCLALAVGCVSCSPLFILESDYTNSATLPAYASFEFTDTDRSGRDSLSPHIEGEIRAQLASRGYHRHYKPDFLVTYALIDENCLVQGLLQPRLGKSSPALRATDTGPQEADAKKYLLKTGTLLIQLVDARSYTVVWQGYASGFHYDRRVPAQKRARKFVRDIFDQYPFFAKNFLLADRLPASGKTSSTR